ncbi:SPOR domain-containing protein [Phaeospirillum tilakii]|uniref:SPOR domain-containing protein n=1 Tax=Phaeospirillum tilakii TaxID=741673 RepID=A0ABW5C8T9_9PROT
MSDTDKINTKERILLCGASAAIPALINLYYVDFETVFLDVTPLKSLGYIVRLLILFCSGALIGWIYDSERDRKKLFNLGLAAPALLMGTVNAAHVQPKQDPAGSVHRLQSYIGIISEAYAQSNDKDIKKFETSTQTEQFLEGLGVIIPKKTYWVIVGSASSEAQALALLKQLKTQHSDLGFDFQAYTPRHPNKNWSIVMGNGVGSLVEAQILVKLAAKAGIASDAFITTYAGGNND